MIRHILLEKFDDHFWDKPEVSQNERETISTSPVASIIADPVKWLTSKTPVAELRSAAEHVCAFAPDIDMDDKSFQLYLPVYFVADPQTTLLWALYRGLYSESTQQILELFGIVVSTSQSGILVQELMELVAARLPIDRPILQIYFRTAEFGPSLTGYMC